MGKMDENTQRAYLAAIECADQYMQKLKIELDLSAEERKFVRRLGEQLVAHVIESFRYKAAISTATASQEHSESGEPQIRSVCYSSAVAFALAAINEFAKKMDKPADCENSN